MSADFWAGYISGAAGLVIGNPLDLIKVRLQAQSSVQPTLALPQPSASSPAVAAPSPRPQIHTWRDALRGLPAPVLTYGALNALLFTTYNRSLYLLARPDSANHPSSTLTYDVAATYPYWAHFTAGALAGLATFIISAPTELVKCRAQVITDAASSSSSSSPSPSRATGISAPDSSWQIAKTTLRTQGIRGLYHGGVVTSLRDSLGYGVYFWTYEASKDAWASFSPAAAHDAGITPNEAAKILVCGGIAGIATWASIFPLDVIKTRVQTQPQALPLGLQRSGALAVASAAVPGAMAASEHTPLVPAARAASQDPAGLSAPRPDDAAVRGQNAEKAAGAWKLAKQAYRTEGAGVFFRGLTVCCVRAFIVNAVQWAVYEWMMRELT